MLSNVLSSKVGPRPPVVTINSGFRLNVSRMARAVSFTSSGNMVMRLTFIPKDVARFDNQ